MTDDQPTQPLTGFELDNIEGRWQRYVALRDADSMETSVHDVPDLLAEVKQLRAALTAISRNESAAANRALALQGQLDKARKALFDDAFEGHAQRYRALAHVLGLDQSGEGQANGLRTWDQLVTEAGESRPSGMLGIPEEDLDR